jgi:hypothetical protein
MADSVEDIPTAQKQKAEKQVAAANQEFRVVLGEAKNFEWTASPNDTTMLGRVGFQIALLMRGCRKGKPRFPGDGGAAERINCGVANTSQYSNFTENR